MAAVYQDASVDLGNIGLLGNGSISPPRKHSGSFTKTVKEHLLFERTAECGGKTDFVEIEGMEPIEGISADWSKSLMCPNGMLVPPAPVFFDFSNADGSKPWGCAARGTIVVTIRGGIVSFDEMAHNAAEAGALGLIVIDNEPKWKNNYVLTPDTLTEPPVPAVLISHKYNQIMCSGCNGAKVSIMRRSSKLAKAKIVKNVMKSMLPF